MIYKYNQSVYVTFIVSETDTLKMSYIQSLEIPMYNLIDEDQCDFTEGELTYELERYLNEECTPTGYHANIVNWWPLRK